MQFKTLTTRAAAAILATSAASLAETHTETIAQGNIEANPEYSFTEDTIRRGMFGLEVEAEGPGIEIERVYRRDGSLREEEIEDGEREIDRTFARSGELLSENIEDGDDDDYDDEYEDDDDDDRDDDDDDDDRDEDDDDDD